jgi:hypothetical protein
LIPYGETKDYSIFVFQQTLFKHQPPINLSTTQPINPSTSQPLNNSTPQPENGVRFPAQVFGFLLDNLLRFNDILKLSVSRILFLKNIHILIQPVRHIIGQIYTNLFFIGSLFAYSYSQRGKPSLNL